MSDLWVAVTAEYLGTTFSHRAAYLNRLPELHVVHAFNIELDNAASIVRRGLAASLPPQWPVKPNRLLSDHEKIIAIQQAVSDESTGYEGKVVAIEKILDS